MSYAKNRAWSDQFIPAIKAVVGPHLLVEASFEVDTQQAADLVVMRADNVTIACRVRRPGYALDFPWDFTIRAKLDNGHKTEFSKIIDGWGDWMFYGHAGSEASLSRWFIVDLHKFRAELIRDQYRSEPVLPDPRRPIPNGDGTYFLAYDVRCFRTGIVIASSHQIPEPQTEAA
jgi:hypothetical protein